jgi:hypothetical protein
LLLLLPCCLLLSVAALLLLPCCCCLAVAVNSKTAVAASCLAPPCPPPLSDFLGSTLDRGGLDGMLALNGIFLLVTRHGLEYPRFYARLYQLFTPEVFHVSLDWVVESEVEVGSVAVRRLACRQAGGQAGGPAGRQAGGHAGM